MSVQHQGLEDLTTINGPQDFAAVGTTAESLYGVVAMAAGPGGARSRVGDLAHLPQDGLTPLSQPPWIRYFGADECVQ